MTPGFQRPCIFVLIVAGLVASIKASTCNESLVDTVTDDELTASSNYKGDFSADKARMSSSGWIPAKLDDDPWIQVKFGQLLTFMAVVTKWRFYYPFYKDVMKYKVKYSNTSSNWSTVQHSTTNEFIANSDTTTPVTNTLPSPIVARYLRLYPTEYHSYHSFCFDVIGCEASPTSPDATTRLESTSFNSSQYGTCQCTCTKANGSLTAQELKTKIEAVVQNLSVTKEKTSKYIRSKTSAQDSRPEVVYVGSVAIVILSLIASLVVLPDLYAMLRFFYSTLKRNQKINIADF